MGRKYILYISFWLIRYWQIPGTGLGCQIIDRKQKITSDLYFSLSCRVFQSVFAVPSTWHHITLDRYITFLTSDTYSYQFSGFKPCDHSSRYGTYRCEYGVSCVLDPFSLFPDPGILLNPDLDLGLCWIPIGTDPIRILTKIKVEKVFEKNK